MQWLDVSRVLCMLLVVYMHFPPEGLKIFLWELAIASAVPFFLFWAGYFCAGKASWSNVFKRSYLFVCVFLVWESLAWLLNLNDSPQKAFHGLGQILVSQTGGGFALPYIAPLWFIRDLIILTLLTPIFLKLRGIITPVIFLFLSYVPLSIAHEINTVISIGTCLIYIIGVYSHRYKVLNFLDKQKTHSLSLFFIIVGLLSSLIALKNNFFDGDSWSLNSWHPTLFGYVCGTALISTAGILAIRTLPSLGEKIARIAPGMLLVLIIHIPLGNIIDIRNLLPGKLSVLQAPILMFLSLCIFYLLNRFLKKAMPYIAATK